MSIAEKLTTIAENEQKVYNAGYEKGKAEGGGGDNYYDTFWDGYQENGNKTNYEHAFRGKHWNDITFTPKYKMKPTIATYMFYGTEISNGEKIGEYVDFSQAPSMSNAFVLCSSILEFPTLNCSSATNFNATFQHNYYTTKIEKIILNEQGTATFSNTFSLMYALKEIRFEGVIGTTIGFPNSPLSVDSMKSIISCLKNYKGTDKQDTYTLTFSANCWSTLEASGTAPDGGTWKAYVANLGWLT